MSSSSEPDVKWLIVGLSGVTCGGKTTLSNAIAAYLQAHQDRHVLHPHIALGRTHIVHQDEYFLEPDDPRHELVAGLGHNNWELPSALDGARMLSDIEAVFGNTTNLFRPGLSRLPGRLNVLLIEGFVIFNEPMLLQLCHLKFHLHLPYEKCFERRRRRVYVPADVVGYFERCVWPMYQRNFQTYRDRSDMFMLNGELHTERIRDFVLDSVRKLLSRSVRTDTGRLIARR